MDVKSKKVAILFVGKDKISYLCKRNRGEILFPQMHKLLFRAYRKDLRNLFGISSKERRGIV